MIHLSKEYKKLLFKHFDISQNWNPKINLLIDLLIEYDYKRNDLNETILFLELIHELLVNVLEKEN